MTTQKSTQWIITGAGPDKPGIVAGLTQLLFKNGFNIDDSSMTILADEFAMLLLVSGSNEKVNALREGLKHLEQHLQLSLSIKSRDVAQVSQSRQEMSGVPYLLSVSGADHTGITFKVAQVLAQHHINITDLNAQCIDGETGPVYIMMIETLLPDAGPNPALTEALKQLEQTEHLEIRMHPLETATF
jgi:glycine cleavage system transcriptional repressor